MAEARAAMGPVGGPSSARRRRRWKRWRSFETWGAVALLLLLAAYLGVLEISKPHVGGDRLRFDTYNALVSDGRVRTARILDQDAYAVGDYVRDDGSVGRYNVPLLQGSQSHLLDLLVDGKVPSTVDQQEGKKLITLASVLLPALILVVLVVLFAYLVVAHRRGTGLFSVRSGAQRVRDQHVAVTFGDVAGQDAAVREMRELKALLVHPERAQALGAVAPKGVLLFGPPGSGKTLLAKALAGEAGASFFSISGSDFVELYVGVGAARVRQLFREARDNAPAVIFIDELDSVGRARSTGIGNQGHAEHEQALNQILAEMDGFANQTGVVVLAATNRPDVLDQALLRPGRFDRTIGLDRPNEESRLAILRLHARSKPLGGDVKLDEIARLAIGLTGADLASVLNEGALTAARGAEPHISQSDLTTALERILQSPERQRRLALRERSVGTRFASDERITFSDVAGAEEILAELAELRDYLAWPDRFARLGARAPRGVLLSGPPGCGKTLLARALAGEANAAFISVAASEFVQMFAGEGAARVRNLFAEARSLAPAILFVDEIDAIGSRRGTQIEGHNEREQTLNQILVELDGFNTAGSVMVLAATNRADILDPALVRPGRFDRHLTVSPPDRAGRVAILRLLASHKPMEPDVDLAAIAALTRGLSGADLANVLNEAALLAARRSLDAIPHALVEESVDRMRIGVVTRASQASEEELRLTACHEAGHALVAMSLPQAVPPHRLTIVGRGGAGGYCTFVEVQDSTLWTRGRLLDQMAALLGGRAAEDLVFGEPASASSADLRQVADLAARMVREYAMTDSLGPMAFPPEMRLEGVGPSEDLARLVDIEVRSLIGQAYSRARRVVATGRAALDRITEALLVAETLTADQLAQLARLGDAAPAGRVSRPVFPAPLPPDTVA